MADRAASHRSRVLDLAFLAASLLPQFSDHQVTEPRWTFPHDPDASHPKYLVGDFHDRDGVRVTQEQSSAARGTRSWGSRSSLPSLQSTSVEPISSSRWRPSLSHTSCSFMRRSFPIASGGDL